MNQIKRYIAFSSTEKEISHMFSEFTDEESNDGALLYFHFICQ